MVFTTIFPGLRKEWRNAVARIGALLGKVLLRMMERFLGQINWEGFQQLIAPRSVHLPITISLPNLLINKPPVLQKVRFA